MIDDETCEMLIYNSLTCWKSLVTNPNCFKNKIFSKKRRRECFKAWTGLGTNDDMSICNYETSLVTAIGENIV